MVQWWFEGEEEEEKHFLLLTRHRLRVFNVEAGEKRRFVFINQSRNSKPFSFVEQMPSNFRFGSEPEKQMWNEFNWSLDERTIKTRKKERNNILLSNKQSNVIQIHGSDWKSHFSLDSTNNFIQHFFFRRWPTIRCATVRRFSLDFTIKIC